MQWGGYHGGAGRGGNGSGCPLREREVYRTASRFRFPQLPQHRRRQPRHARFPRGFLFAYTLGHKAVPRGCISGHCCRLLWGLLTGL